MPHQGRLFYDRIFEVEALLNQGGQVTIYDRAARPGRELVDEVLWETKVYLVYHLKFQSLFEQEHPDRYFTDVYICPRTLYRENIDNRESPLIQNRQNQLSREFVADVLLRCQIVTSEPLDCEPDPNSQWFYYFEEFLGFTEQEVLRDLAELLGVEALSNQGQSDWWSTPFPTRDRELIKPEREPKETGSRSDKMLW